MKVAIFSTKDYEKHYFDLANQSQHTLVYIQDTLSPQTIEKAKGCEAICCFVTDDAGHDVVEKAAALGIKLIALRSAGFDNVDLETAKANQITVTRVPKYSPEAIAEFCVTLMLTLAREIPQTNVRTSKGNFSLEGLLGFNLHGKTVGIIGTGNIGTALAKIMLGFGCFVLANDPFPNKACTELGVKYVDLKTLLSQSDIISLNCLLNNETHHLINQETLSIIKPGAMLINTGRGSLVDTGALMNALNEGQLGSAGLDVYENEKGLYFIDHKNKPIADKQFIALQNMSNVLITGHQAFFTQEAVESIAQTTINNITAFLEGKPVNTL